MKLSDIILENRYNEGGYEEGDIKLMGDLILPIDKEIVLQAEEDKYNRGLLVTNNKDKSYDIAYWADTFEPYPIEVEIDGKSVAKEAILEGRSLSEPSEEMEKVIDSGIRPHYDDIDNIRDVMYYVHNNWMENEISAEEAMRKISKFLT